MLPPGEFLPVFEHYKMMPQLDRWVVRQVVRRLARGAKPTRVTINISAQTIADAEFPRFFAAEAKAAPAGSLLFEVAEADLLARPEPVERFIAAIKALTLAVKLAKLLSIRLCENVLPTLTIVLDAVPVELSVRAIKEVA